MGGGLLVQPQRRLLAGAQAGLDGVVVAGGLLFGGAPAAVVQNLELMLGIMGR